MKGVVGLSIEITRLEGKYKMSQIVQSRISNRWLSNCKLLKMQRAALSRR